MAARKLYDVGHVFHDRKELIKEVDKLTNQRAFLWKCLLCEKEHGPTTIGDIKRYPSSACCPSTNTNPDQCRGWKDITSTKMLEIWKAALKRKLDFEVDAKYLWSVWEKQEGKCAYTGRSLTHGVDASLDRLDSSKGYLEENVQWVHRRVNVIKWDATEEEFLSICEEVTQYRKRTENNV